MSDQQPKDQTTEASTLLHTSIKPEPITTVVVIDQLPRVDAIPKQMAIHDYQSLNEGERKNPVTLLEPSRKRLGAFEEKESEQHTEGSKIKKKRKHKHKKTESGEVQHKTFNEPQKDSEANIHKTESLKVEEQIATLDVKATTDAEPDHPIKHKKKHRKKKTKDTAHSGPQKQHSEADEEKKISESKQQQKVEASDTEKHPQDFNERGNDLVKEADQHKKKKKQRPKKKKLNQALSNFLGLLLNKYLPEKGEKQDLDVNDLILKVMKLSEGVEQKGQQHKLQQPSQRVENTAHIGQEQVQTLAEQQTQSKVQSVKELTPVDAEHDEQVEQNKNEKTEGVAGEKKKKKRKKKRNKHKCFKTEGNQQQDIGQEDNSMTIQDRSSSNVMSNQISRQAQAANEPRQQSEVKPQTGEGSQHRQEKTLSNRGAQAHKLEAHQNVIATEISDKQQAVATSSKHKKRRKKKKKHDSTNSVQGSEHGPEDFEILPTQESLLRQERKQEMKDQAMVSPYVQVTAQNLSEKKKRKEKKNKVNIKEGDDHPEQRMHTEQPEQAEQQKMCKEPIHHTLSSPQKGEEYEEKPEVQVEEFEPTQHKQFKIAKNSEKTSPKKMIRFKTQISDDRQQVVDKGTDTEMKGRVLTDEVEKAQDSQEKVEELSDKNKISAQGEQGKQESRDESTTKTHRQQMKDKYKKKRKLLKKLRDLLINMLVRSEDQKEEEKEFSAKEEGQIQYTKPKGESEQSKKEPEEKLNSQGEHTKEPKQVVVEQTVERIKSQLSEDFKPSEQERVYSEVFHPADRSLDHQSDQSKLPSTSNLPQVSPHLPLNIHVRVDIPSSTFATEPSSISITQHETQVPTSPTHLPSQIEPTQPTLLDKPSSSIPSNILPEQMHIESTLTLPVLPTDNTTQFRPLSREIEPLPHLDSEQTAQPQPSLIAQEAQPLSPQRPPESSLIRQPDSDDLIINQGQSNQFNPNTTGHQSSIEYTASIHLQSSDIPSVRHSFDLDIVHEHNTNRRRVESDNPSQSHPTDYSPTLILMQPQQPRRVHTESSSHQQQEHIEQNRSVRNDNAFRLNDDKKSFKNDIEQGNHNIVSPEGSIKEHIDNLNLSDIEQKNGQQSKRSSIDHAAEMSSIPHQPLVYETQSIFETISVDNISHTAETINQIQQSQKPVIPKDQKKPIQKPLPQPPITHKQIQIYTQSQPITSPQVISKPEAIVLPSTVSTTPVSNSRHYGIVIISARERMEQVKREEQRKKQQLDRKKKEQEQRAIGIQPSVPQQTSTTIKSVQSNLKKKSSFKIARSLHHVIEDSKPLPIHLATRISHRQLPLATVQKPHIKKNDATSISLQAHQFIQDKPPQNSIEQNSKSQINIQQLKSYPKLTKSSISLPCKYLLLSNEQPPFNVQFSSSRETLIETYPPIKPFYKKSQQNRRESSLETPIPQMIPVVSRPVVALIITTDNFPIPILANSRLMEPIYTFPNLAKPKRSAKPPAVISKPENVPVGYTPQAPPNEINLISKVDRQLNRQPKPQKISDAQAVYSCLPLREIGYDRPPNILFFTSRTSQLGVETMIQLQKSYKPVTSATIDSCRSIPLNIDMPPQLGIQHISIPQLYLNINQPIQKPALNIRYHGYPAINIPTDQDALSEVIHNQKNNLSQNILRPAISTTLLQSPVFNHSQYQPQRASDHITQLYSVTAPIDDTMIIKRPEITRQPKKHQIITLRHPDYTTSRLNPPPNQPQQPKKSQIRRIGLHHKNNTSTNMATKPLSGLAEEPSSELSAQLIRIGLKKRQYHQRKLTQPVNTINSPPYQPVQQYNFNIYSNTHPSPYSSPHSNRQSPNQTLTQRPLEPTVTDLNLENLMRNSFPTQQVPYSALKPTERPVIPQPQQTTYHKPQSFYSRSQRQSNELSIHDAISRPDILLTQGISPSSQNNNPIIQSSFQVPWSNNQTNNIVFRDSLEQYPFHIINPGSNKHTTQPLHTLPDKLSLSPQQAQVQKRNYPNTFIETTTHDKIHPLGAKGFKGSPGKTIKYTIMGAPIEESDIVARTNFQEVKLQNQPQVIITKKASIALPINKQLQGLMRSIEPLINPDRRKIIRLVPRKLESSSRSKHDIIQEQSNIRIKQERHESAPKSSEQVIRIKAVGESTDQHTRTVPQLRLKVTGHLKYVESSKSKQRSLPKDKHITFTYFNKLTVAPIKQVTIKNQQHEKLQKSKTQSRPIAERYETMSKQSTPLQISQRTPIQIRQHYIVNPIPISVVQQAQLQEQHRKSRIQQSPLTNKPNINAGRTDNFNNTQPNPITPNSTLKATTHHLGPQNYRKQTITSLLRQQRNEQQRRSYQIAFTDRSRQINNQFGSPARMLVDDNRSRNPKPNSNPQSKDSKSIDSERRRKGLTLFDDGLSEWRKNHKAQSSPSNKISNDLIFGYESENRKQIESMVTPLHTRERSRMIEVEPRATTLSPEAVRRHLASDYEAQREHHSKSRRRGIQIFSPKYGISRSKSNEPLQDQTIHNQGRNPSYHKKLGGIKLSYEVKRYKYQIDGIKKKLT